LSRFGERGGWWVAGQFALLGAAVAAPKTPAPAVPAAPFHWAGAALLAFSAAVLAAGSLKLGKRLTPFPKPVEGASLETTGIYGVVRHPLYFGVVLAAFGIAAVKLSLWSLLFAAALAVLLNAKADREEEWLAGRFPEYRSYRLRTRKLIPFIF
jgi:protein-S-isoprenylcysteine O-methyltransferase Ste14